MQFALVDDNRMPAAPGFSGVCPACSQPLISKCGIRRIWHWAHKGKQSCDSWYEPETPWHRRWKDEFPPEYQEVLHLARSGERHIADVKTEYGLVIEFQHSYIDPKEQWARERFYPNLVWVVDGTRLKRDLPRFLKGKQAAYPGHGPNYLATHFPDECFPSAWIRSSVPVVFDFTGVPAEGSADNADEKLWCLLPGRSDRRAIFGALSRREFLARARTQRHIVPAHRTLFSLPNSSEIGMGPARVPYASEFQRWLYYNNRRRRRF